ncbi:MAG TPA: multidrug effflux MFS transporter [Steroidobacteraceae bacterium]|nr:multidrug effflux MFS transporter [Steroidobacteraceae bacterium]
MARAGAQVRGPEGAPGSNSLRLLLILGSIAAFAPLSIDMYLPGFPAMARALGAPFALVQLTLPAFFIGLCVGHLFYGPIADRFGRLLPLKAGLAIFVLASAGCALARDVHTLIALRVVQALGGCAGMVIVVAIVRDLFDAQGSARMFSRLMLVMGAAPVLAPFLGTYVVAWSGWRAIFWILALYGVICLVALSLWLPETRPAQPARRLHPFAIAREYAALVVDRRFLGYALSGALGNAAYFVYLTGSPFVLMELFGLSPTTYSLIFALNTLGLIVGSQVNDRLLATRTLDQLLRAGNVSSLVLTAALLLVVTTQLAGAVVVVTLLFGFCTGRALIRPNSTAGALEHHPDRAGTAAALIGALQFALGTAGGAVLGVTHDGTARPFAAVLMLMSLLGVIAHRVLVRHAPAASAGG